MVLASQPLHRSEDYFKRLFAGKLTNSVIVFPTHEEFIKHHLYFNAIIRDVAKDAGVWFIDNDLSLGGEDEYFIDHIHYTVLGVEKLAQNYLEFLISKHIIE